MKGLLAVVFAAMLATSAAGAAPFPVDCARTPRFYDELDHETEC